VGYVPYRLIQEIPATAGESRLLPTLAGAVLVAVGALQFTPRKIRCLRVCRTPRAAIRGMDPLGSFATSSRTGLGHGWHCLGCCWALMVVLLVVGVMNLAWMVVISAVFLVDKHWARGEGLSQVVGAGLVALGLVVVAFPDVLPYLSGVDLDAPMKMGDMPM
jgi:predicted metal-binding membrane protein